MNMSDVVDPRRFEELWREDQLAEEDGKPSETYYRHPDGEIFLVYFPHPDGSVTTDSNRHISAAEFQQCEKVG